MRKKDRKIKKDLSTDVEKEERRKRCELLSISVGASYKEIGSIGCPILGTEVVFNRKGYHHLHYKPDGTSRNVEERIHKLALFPLAIPVIKNAIGIKEERDVEIKATRKKGAKIKKGKTYALVALVGEKNPVAVRVIILRVGDGNYMFWSIMKN